MTEGSRVNLGRMLRALVLAVVASALVYAVMVVASDGDAVLAALRQLSWGTVLAVLAMSTVAYALRGVRWGWLMGGSGHHVSVGDALYLHLSGQIMGVSPGRVGEVFKPWLAREVAGMPMSAGLALVFAERVADLIAVCILALGGLSIIGGGVWTVVVALGAIIAGTAVASSRWFHALAMRILRRQRWIQRHLESLSTIGETLATALSWRTLVWSVPVSLVAWGLEGLGLWLLLGALGPLPLGAPAVVAAYALATLVGAFTFLPAGIGLTEASLAGVLVASRVTASVASLSTLLIRVATLWWSVLLGWIALGSRPAIARRIFAGQAVEE